MDPRRRFALIKILQLVLGLTTYILYMVHHANAAVVSRADSSNEAFARSSFGMTTITAFPFIIVSCTVIVYLLNNHSVVENNLLQFLFSIMGFGMYLITGLMVFYFCGDYTFCSGGMKTTAGFLLGTSIVYLVEVVFGAMDRCR